MKLLLSNGESTNSSFEYVRDLIYINLLLLPKEVPYFDGGSKELISGIELNEVKNNITDVVNDVINKTKQKIDIGISLEKINITSDLVTINIKINGKVESYDIQKSNN
jgi:hypothetical protein